MPKMKSHSGAKKRFKVTGSGKVTYKKSGQRHLLTGMSANRGRRLRKGKVVTGRQAKMLRSILP